MYKVGICGHFAIGKNLSNGQTIHTKTVAEELKNILGDNNVCIVDSHGWKKSPFKLIYNCFILSKRSTNIVMFPANNGLKVFVPLFIIFRKLFRNKLHYVVVGGWLPDLVKKDKVLVNRLKKLDGIYVQTYSMINLLNEAGLNNVFYFPNSKKLNILNEDELVYNYGLPYKLCTFSRVMEEKGIEDAVAAVKNVNTEFGKTVFTLDIYGQVEIEYKKQFEILQKEFPDYINYKGVVPFNESVNVLKYYFAMLFPSYYEGEGFPGTILDAYASGLPVIATDWKYNSEIIKNRVDGIVYIKSSNSLFETLFQMQRNPDEINEMKQNCINRAKEYLPERVVGTLVKKLG